MFGIHLFAPLAVDEMAGLIINIYSIARVAFPDKKKRWKTLHLHSARLRGIIDGVLDQDETTDKEAHAL